MQINSNNRDFDGALLDEWKHYSNFVDLHCMQPAVLRHPFVLLMDIFLFRYVQPLHSWETPLSSAPRWCSCDAREAGFAHIRVATPSFHEHLFAVVLQ